MAAARLSTISFVFGLATVTCRQASVRIHSINVPLDQAEKKVTAKLKISSSVFAISVSEITNYKTFKLNCLFLMKEDATCKSGQDKAAITVEVGAGNTFCASC
jgi:hypothetical protein